jgi:hypothetical protein
MPVPGTPGADGNARAVAVCLECALLIRRHNIRCVIIVFFNREDDGLLGSNDLAACFANNRREPSGRRIFQRGPGSPTIPQRRYAIGTIHKFGYARQTGYVFDCVGF